jgi:nicotinamidase/pyrazinamidase
MTPHTALILVDLQHDFMPGGALAVAHANEVIPLANQLQSRYDLIVATQDWHPAHHKSFASQHPGKQPGELIDLKGLPQVLWPDHCVQGTHGARFVDTLDMRQVAAIFRKGMDPDVDSYSGFFDNGHVHTTGLAGYLREHAISEVHVLGVATDYCVKFTALDALREKFHVKLLLPACRGVELKAGDVDAAVNEMSSQGIEIVRTL